MIGRIAALSSELHECFYRSPEVRHYSIEGQRIIETLFLAYEARPPEKISVLRERTGDSLSEAVKDYIAGMTDQYASTMVKGVSGK
jgi:dGTP triphosphohydrolase